MRKHKRAIAFLLAAALAAGPAVNYIYVDSFAMVHDHDGEWTGLKLKWSEIPKTDGQGFGWPRKTYFEGGTGEFKDMNGRYTFCVANHTGQPPQGTEAWVSQALSIQDYKDFKGNERVSYGREEEVMRKFAFCLAAAAAVAPGQQSLSDCRSMYSTTELQIMAQSVLLAIEGRMSRTTDHEATILTMDRAAAYKAYCNAMQYEYHLDPYEWEGTTTQLHPSITEKLLAKREKFFNDCWDAAIVMYNAIQNTEAGVAANRIAATQNPANPNQYIATLPCYNLQSVWESYYKNMKLDGKDIGPGGWRIVKNEYNAATGNAEIIFEGPAGADFTKADFTIQFENQGFLTDLSQPVLYEMDFCANNAENKFQHGGFQTMFCAMQKDMSLTPGNPGGGGGGGGEGGEGSITLEVHRYKHSEDWQTTYNVDLRKLDSETGKPLKGSHWDILEYDTLGDWGDAGTQLGSTYLDHPKDEASTIGVKYNWANDSGTQFTRWEDEDACNRDDNVTGADGYLYETNTVGNPTSTKAHSDTYDYTYTKGYCTGHPKPIIEYYECNHEEGEDCDCDELNAELDRLAEEAWQKQVDYCEQLAAEGGFFHTAEESISDAAKNELIADRDQFYDDFISLTYDYSAEEIAARDGYILHGNHTDDIPVERVVIHSSEYLSEKSGASSNAAVVNRSETEITIENDLNLDLATESGAEKEPEVLLSKTQASQLRPKKESITETKETMESKPESESQDFDEETDMETEMEKDESEIPDLDITDEGVVIATDSDATSSDAVRDEVEQEEKSFFHILKEKAYEFLSIQGDEENREEKDGAARDSQPPKTEGVTYIGNINFEASDVTPHMQGDRDIKCWTFIIYDHRTEGEIHFNKRDLDLVNGDDYDETYAAENGDGTLEGAVYGLFAMTDIIHPDSEQKTENDQDTGVVYQAGDLVAVTTTDRNGDASFMTITEAPGMTYDYDQGKIVKRTDAWDGPGNLHAEQGKADAAVQDNEKFVGWDADGSSEVTLTDSEPGGNDHTDEHYHKHSSNQGLNKGEGQDDGTTYPISNNEDNNGNCWIGRPLIVSGKNPANYYIKELSRSEGYELSVYGKDMLNTNKEAFANGGEVSVEGTVSIGKISLIEKQRDNGKITSYNDIMITGQDTVNGFDVSFKNLTQNQNLAQFYTVKQTKAEKEEEVKQWVEKKFPVMGQVDQPVLINGERVEAQAGDVITLPNGKTMTVQNTITDSGDKLYVPKSSVAYALPKADDFNNASGNTFTEKYNAALKKAAFGQPDPVAPWVLVPIGSSEQESFNNMTSMLAEYTVFHQMRIVGEQNGYYVVQYSLADTPESVYDFKNQIVFVKKEVSMDGGNGYLYAQYDATQLPHNNTGFVINNQKPSKANISRYEDLSQITYADTVGKTWWAYAEGEQKYESNGDPATITKMVEETVTQMVTKIEEEETAIPADHVVWNPATNTYTVHFDGAGKYLVRIRYNEETTNGIVNAAFAKNNAVLGYYIAPQTAGSYIEDVQLGYPGSSIVMQDAGTITNPTKVQERPIRQKIKISKDIQTLPNPKVVWYCGNCGYENADGTASCGYCSTKRTSEETKTVRYAHDTYSAVHSENRKADGSDEGILDWLTQLLGGGVKDQSAKDVPEFRFKAYLKSNLERLYRNPDGEIVWMDRNGNVMTPQYQDTNGDGNYDTFTWKYTDAYNGKTVDWPEKDKVSDDGSLQSSNVQKVYTKVEHNTDSDTTSHRANNVWSTYLTPQSDQTDEVAEKESYSTSERVDGVGNNGEASGLAIRGSDSLYSYAGTNEDVAKSDRLNDKPNTEYIRLLETTKKTMEDGAGATREVEMYNYEKFFDAIHAGNLDIWDDDMHSTFTGNSMKNYPGQHWFETFYEKYQRDDADPSHTLENTDNADKDNTAGGDKDTSFKPFRWIRGNVFGDRTDYEKYPAEHNGENTEISMSTSDFAKANAEASDAVRQFATKWYLEQETAKLMKDNGVGENIAKAEDGTLQYDEAVYDEALFHAIAKSYNYLKPFYVYDLDTIYSVEWDSAANGGTDKDYTTLSVDLDDDAEVYNVSSYLPYGVYVIVEQQPMRRDDAVNDWDNRSYTIEKPKEVILPSLYDAAESNDTTDNYAPHYNYDPAQTSEEQAKTDNYLIRFGEEWSDVAPNAGQDERQYVIRAHGYDGDFEVYKYGLDVDLLNRMENRHQGGITTANGTFSYAGWNEAQEEFDPLKDTYNTEHRGKDGAEKTPAEDGGNDGAGYDGAEKTNGADTANGSSYNGTAIENRYFYASVSEDKGSADDVMFKGGSTDDNNVSGMQWKDDVVSMTGELTAYKDKYASMLVPWTVTAPADIHTYDSKNFSGYADVNERDGFYTTFLRVNKTDSETGEYILHDDAIFGLYAGSRYQSFDEIEKDSKLIKDAAEREQFLAQFKPGDAKFYLQDIQIEGTREFLMAMGAKDITPIEKRNDIPAAGVAVKEICTGIVPKGTPICVESEQIMLTDQLGNRTGQMTVYTTNNDVKVAGEENAADKTYQNQNTGYFLTPQPVGAGVYVLAELKAPNGYARSKPVAYEVYSDKTQYYADGDMYQKVTAVRYEGNLMEDIDYEN